MPELSSEQGQGAPNPEQRSSNAMLCLCIGLALVGGAYFLGFGAVAAAAFSGGNPTIIVGSVTSAIALVLAAVCGFVLAVIGGIWLVVRVIVDQVGGADAIRYRDVNR